MSAYGYEIVQTLIVDIEPDERVKRAMNEINAGMFSRCSCFCFSYRVIHISISSIEKNLNVSLVWCPGIS